MTATRTLVERLSTDAAYLRHRSHETLRTIGNDCEEAAAAISALEAERDEALYALEAERMHNAQLFDRTYAAEARAEKLAEALKPFAEYMGDRGDLDYHGNPLPDEQGVGWVYLTQADFRRAREALNSIEAKP